MVCGAEEDPVEALAKPISPHRSEQPPCRSVHLLVRAYSLQEDRFLSLELDELEDDPALHAHEPAKLPFSLCVRSTGWYASCSSCSRAACMSTATCGRFLSALRAALTKAVDRNRGLFTGLSHP